MHLRQNPIQFAVVREDPEIELSFVPENAKRVLLIASGGCTAFAFGTRRPEVGIDLIEPNPAQIELVRKKTTALRQEKTPAWMETFSIGKDSALALNSCGNFESLFRELRKFLFEFVISEKDLKAALSAGEDLTPVFSHRYWPVAFDLFFSDSILNEMFTTAATQHAPKGSYPAYFRRQIETGMKRADRGDNYFLHHFLFGHYLPHSLPTYLNTDVSGPEFTFHEKRIQDVQTFVHFDLISFSNIFDWMNSDEISSVGETLGRTAKTGSRIIFRQLNHTSNIQSSFPGFEFDEILSTHWQEKDRSLFYSRINFGVKK